MTDTYSINCRCSNCDHAGPKELPKGTLVPDKFACPNCGCETAVKCAKPAPSPTRDVSPFEPWRNPRRTDWPPRILTRDFPDVTVRMGCDE